MSGTARSNVKKSGLRAYKAGDIIFQENDVAESLFIIQSGQIRLYRPKGRGFIDLAVLRTGEVIGEMAYFDEKNQRRSCSAAAIVPTDVIEISFQAFEKTMSGLNPWLKIIINTLVDRLRSANEKVKSLEPNSVGFGKQGRIADYTFFHTKDVMRILSTFYLVINNYGEQKDPFWEIHVNRIRFFMFDVYNIPEIKYEEFTNMLKSEYFISIGDDEDGLPKIIKIEDPERFREMMVFFNNQRILDDEKKLRISFKCERFLQRIIEQLEEAEVDKPRWKADITVILEDFKAHNIPITERDLRDAVEAGFVEDILVGEGNKLTSVINYEKLQKMFPSIRMMNAVKRINEAKAGERKS